MTAESTTQELFERIKEKFGLNETAFRLKEKIVYLYANNFYFIKAANESVYVKRVGRINGEHLRCTYQMLLDTDIKLLNRLFKTLK